MIDRSNFESEHDNFKIIVKAPCYWWIMKDKVVVDCCYYHPNIAKDELQSKVQAERALSTLLETSNLDVS